MSGPALHTLILYDGVCGMCTRVVQWVLARDRHDRFRFAPLQSELARGLLEQYGLRAESLDTVYAVSAYPSSRQRVVAKADAALEILRTVGGPWRLTQVFRLLPRALTYRVYDYVARHRYGWFGKLDHCEIPTPAERAKFLAS